jgi:DNA-binding GntR family transcriptional regulator
MVLSHMKKPRISSDEVVDFIRKKILAGDYPQGHALNSKKLAASIGVSRTPVREALRRLEAKGLVEIVPHFGAHVRAVELGELVEICAMRQALEGYLAGVAAEVRTDADVRALAGIVESMRRIVDRMTTPEKEKALAETCGREDIRFHMAIMSSARNKFIMREILRLHLISRVALSNAPVIPEKATPAGRRAREKRRRFVHATHERIFQAIKNRDSRLARDLTEGHIQEVIDQKLGELGRERSVTAEALTEDEAAYLIG